MTRITSIPIYGQLFASKKDSLLSALRDLLVTTPFSLMPLWLYPAFGAMFLKDPASFFDSVVNSALGGEMFIYSAALVGPVIYAITKRYKDPEEDGEKQSIFRRRLEFPYGWLFTILSVLVCLLGALCYGAMTATEKLKLDILDSDALLVFSVSLYLFTLSCYYCVSVYRIDLDNFGQADFSNEEKELLRQWRNNRDD